MKKTWKCVLHKYHYPKIYTTELHHIWPKEYHGPTNDSNLIELGPTEHSNIHMYLDRKLAGRTDLPNLSRKEKEVAIEGEFRVLLYINGLV